MQVAGINSSSITLKLGGGSLSRLLDLGQANDKNRISKAATKVAFAPVVNTHRRAQMPVN